MGYFDLVGTLKQQGVPWRYLDASWNTWRWEKHIGANTRKALEHLRGWVGGADETFVTLTGKAGTGKTTAAVGYARSVLFGEGFLDHPHPAKKGSVLFIASDSGPGPLVAVLQSAGTLITLPLKKGREAIPPMGIRPEPRHVRLGCRPSWVLAPS